MFKQKNFNINPYASHNTEMTPIENPNYKSFVDSLVKNSDVILLDTDTAMKGIGFEGMIRSFVPSLRKYNKHITVLQPILQELRYRAASVDQQESEKAAKAREGLFALEKVGIVKFKGNPNEASTGSAAIIRAVTMNIWENNLCVLTQNAKLAEDCKFFTQIKSTKLDHVIHVKRVSNMYGQINNFLDAPPAAPSQSQHSASQAKPVNNAASILRRYGI